MDEGVKTGKINIDKNRRGRMLFLAITLATVLFVIKISQQSSAPSVVSTFGLGAIFFVLSYLGMLLVFRLEINIRSALLIIPQSSFFVMLAVIFLEMFFFRKFARVYEAFLLFAITSFIFGTTYISFLMTNIFNVSSFKQIPLREVAKTVSYVLSIMMVYFATFALLSSGLHIAIITVLLVISYILIAIFHVAHLNLEMRDFFNKALTIVSSLTIIVLPFIFIGGRPEVISIIPVSLFLGFVGVIMHKIQNAMTNLLYLQYFLLFVGALLVAVLIR